MNNDKVRRLAKPATLVLAGTVAGGILAGTLSATAEDSTTTPTPAAPGSGMPPGPRPGPGPGGAETALTGTTKDKVEAAVKAKYPNATIMRTETDATGVYESHIATAGGRPLTVLVGKDFEVTGTEDVPMGGPGPGGPGGPGGGPGMGETPLTGTTKEKVEAAVEAKYPNATIERTETDATGVYEAHITTAGGEHLTVAVDKSFEVTGTQSFPGGPGDA